MAKRRAQAAIFGVAGIALLLSSCTVKKSTDRLVIQLRAEPISLDPARVEDGVGFEILDNVMEGLFGHDGQGHLQNRLAQSYRVSADGKRYEFKIRSDALWSDGVPVQASDFVTGLKRVLDPATASKSSALLSMIQNIRAEGSSLVIELKHRAPYFLEVLTLTACLPERQDILAAHRGKWPEDGPVTGAYQILKHEIENKMTLARNEKYRSPRPSIPTVEYLIVPEESTGVSLFEKGEVDILTRVPPLDVERLRKAHQLRRSELLATYYVAFNTRTKPFHEIKNRKLIANVIRKKEITEALGSGETVAESWLPPRWEKGIQLPERALITNFGLSAPLTIGFDSSSRNSLIMEKIASDIRKETGAKVSLFHQDWKTYIRTLQSDPPSIYRFAWLAPFDDPLPHLQVFTTNNPNNYTGWSSARYDERVEAVAETPAGPLRLKLIQEAEKILTDEAPVVPIFHYVQNHAVSSRVLNFSADPFGVIHLSELSLKR